MNKFSREKFDTCGLKVLMAAVVVGIAATLIYMWYIAWVFYQAGEQQWFAVLGLAIPLTIFYIAVAFRHLFTEPEPEDDEWIRHQKGLPPRPEPAPTQKLDGG